MSMVIAGLIGYFFGSIPSGVLLTYLSGLPDPRRIGSGNIGATNVLRTGHRGLAALTLIVDMGKGIAAVLIVQSLFNPTIGLIAALGAVIGHMFPLWLKFRGGKGVATTIGVILVLWWPLGVAVCVAWIAVAAVARYSSLASLISLGLSPAAAFIFIDDGRYSLVLLIIVSLVFFKHRDNLRRLLSGSEPQIGKTSS